MPLILIDQGYLEPACASTWRCLHHSAGADDAHALHRLRFGVERHPEFGRCAFCKVVSERTCWSAMQASKARLSTSILLEGHRAGGTQAVQNPLWSRLPLRRFAMVSRAPERSAVSSSLG